MANNDDYIKAITRFRNTSNIVSVVDQTLRNGVFLKNDRIWNSIRYFAGLVASFRPEESIFVRNFGERQYRDPSFVVFSMRIRKKLHDLRIEDSNPGQDQLAHQNEYERILIRIELLSCLIKTCNVIYRLIPDADFNILVQEQRKRLEEETKKLPGISMNEKVWIRNCISIIESVYVDAPFFTVESFNDKVSETISHFSGGRLKFEEIEIEGESGNVQEMNSKITRLLAGAKNSIEGALIDPKLKQDVRALLYRNYRRENAEEEENAEDENNALYEFILIKENTVTNDVLDNIINFLLENQARGENNGLFTTYTLQYIIQIINKIKDLVERRRQIQEQVNGEDVVSITDRRDISEFRVVVTNIEFFANDMISNCRERAIAEGRQTHISYFLDVGKLKYTEDNAGDLFITLLDYYTHDVQLVWEDFVTELESSVVSSFMQAWTILCHAYRYSEHPRKNNPPSMTELLNLDQDNEILGMFLKIVAAKFEDNVDNGKSLTNRARITKNLQDLATAQSSLLMAINNEARKRRRLN